MAKVHILCSLSPNRHQAIAHGLVPNGNNKVGIPWKTIAAQLSPNPQAGDSAEKAAIIAGDMIEVAFVLELDPDALGTKMTPANLATTIAAEADRVLAARKIDLSARYNYAGYTTGAVN